ncbi:hypothetical protein PV387_03565 [Streptomyces sp. ME02-6987-2C]|uniref:hypothetical protein n=1 Tax=unclassified Streptomyces TaxID=2593676 RepID=UPI0029A0EBDE|nr:MULTISPECIES: hypothetical protein [unclassified Streptomyces]MDX3345919.1 hypothetical protein [Streptomyces sp. ME02-6979A]MDX3365113.1 hypothetical protein [Streptomyces sp. ME02-6987-2C]MDX3404831.1 hypothetical protein [Streptomyces sp. ME02-6977A]MDX3421685.1 hypothetical protein [Streptomyces sp. ME02-6985-2c]
MNVTITPCAIFVPGPTVTEIGTLALPPTSVVTAPPVVEDLDVCEDCGADLEVHCSSCNAEYCENCEYGI